MPERSIVGRTFGDKLTKLRAFLTQDQKCSLLFSFEGGTELAKASAGIKRDIVKKLLCSGLLFAALLASFNAAADLTLVVSERESALYLSQVCTDEGSAVKLRTCDEGEGGVVIQRRNAISAEGYDWFAVPVEYYFYAVERANEIPLFVNPKIHAVLAERLPMDFLPGYFGQSFWQTSFLFTFKGTYEDEVAIVQASRTNPDRNKFAALCINCSDLMVSVVRLLYPESGIPTPKALAKGAVQLAQMYNPDGVVFLEEVPQLPGTFRRDSPELRAIKEARDAGRSAFNEELRHRYNLEFEALIGAVDKHLIVPAEVKRIFTEKKERGRLSRALFTLFMDQGSYDLDERGRSLLRLTLTDDRIRQVGITRANVLEGDSLSALLVMMGVVDHSLSEGLHQQGAAEGFVRDWDLLLEAACRLNICQNPGAFHH